MRITENLKDIMVHANVDIFLRERGKLLSTRSGHNVFTITGRNLLAKLIGWETVAGVDIPYTNRRVRWMGVGKGSQLEVTTVEGLNDPVKATDSDFLVGIQETTFPTSTTVRFTTEFGTTLISRPDPVAVTEAALFADVSPAKLTGTGLRNGTEDSGYGGDDSHTVLNPVVGTNAPIAYKAFEPLTKTVDFTLTIRWDFRF
jgi:hypothetical protein